MQPMIDHYDVGDPDAEWPNNVVSTRTVVYADGKIAKVGVPVRHYVACQELELCQSFAEAARRQAEGLYLPSETRSDLEPFFVCRNADEGEPFRLDPDSLRELFGGTLFPGIPIMVEPFRLDQSWWKMTVGDSEDPGNPAYTEFLQRWKGLVAWFAEHHPGAVFVRIGDDRWSWEVSPESYPPGTEMPGSCFPRLILNTTPHGSVFGLLCHEVLT